MSAWNILTPNPVGNIGDVNRVWQQLGFIGYEARALPGKFVLGILVPQLLFYLGLRQGLMPALVASAGWTAGLQLYEFVRRRRVDLFLLYGLAFTVLQTAVALFFRSASAYAGGGIVENLLGGLVLLGSITVCRPLLVELVDATIPEQAQTALTLPVRMALGKLTLLWAVVLLLRSAGLYAALTHLAIGQFLIVNTLAGWPFNGVGVLLSLAYVQAQTSKARKTAPKRPLCKAMAPGTS